VALLPLLLSACAVSHLSNPFRSSEPTSSDPNALPPLPSTPSASAAPPPAASASATTLPDGESLHCPQIVAWPHDRLVTIYQGGKAGDPQSIVRRGEITKLVRDCELYPDRAVVKYGIAGRVLIGPKGGPGPVTLGIEVKVADAQHKVLANDAAKVSTVIPSENPVGYFSVVKEISFPIVAGTRPEDYKIFVAFDSKQPGA
jgi:hypothetical protein